MTEQPIPESTQSVVSELDDLEPLLLDQEKILPEEPIRNLLASPTGTSAPLLSNAFLTDTVSKFPLFSFQTVSSIGVESSVENEPQEEINEENQTPDTNPAQPPTPDRVTPTSGRPRCQLPGCKRGNSTSPSKTTATSRGPPARLRRGPRTGASPRAQSRTLERPMTLPNISVEPVSNPTRCRTVNLTANKTLSAENK